MYVLTMTDDGADKVWKNHAYKNAWGSEDMAQTFTSVEEALYHADDMPRYGAYCEITAEELY